MLSGNLPVTIYKRRSSRSLRLSISPDRRQARISIPYWAPYSAGLEFARNRQSWILSNLQPSGALVHGQAIGKAHHLEFIPSANATKASGRVHSSKVTVSHPQTVGVDHREVQSAAEKACIRALRLQAEQLLPQRLSVLALKHGFEFKDVSVKQLKSRWGSCDQHKSIVLNLFLMQLPWELIDYVLLHELVHTKVLKHGPDFWQAMEEKLPEVKELKKKMRQYHPVLSAGAPD